MAVEIAQKADLACNFVVLTVLVIVECEKASVWHLVCLYQQIRRRQPGNDVFTIKSTDCAGSAGTSSYQNRSFIALYWRQSHA